MIEDFRQEAIVLVSNAFRASATAPVPGSHQLCLTLASQSVPVPTCPDFLSSLKRTCTQNKGKITLDLWIIATVAVR